MMAISHMSLERGLINRFLTAFSNIATVKITAEPKMTSVIRINRTEKSVSTIVLVYRNLG